MKAYSAGESDLLRCQQSHPHGNPTTLARSQDKSLVDAHCVHNLDVHNGRIPIRPLLLLGSCLTVSQQLNSHQIHGICELLVAELGAVKVGRRGEGVDEDECRLRAVVRIGEGDGGVYAAEMGDVYDLMFRHCVRLGLSMSFDSYLWFQKGTSKR